MRIMPWPCDCCFYVTFSAVQQIAGLTCYSEKFIVYLATSLPEQRPEQKGKLCVSTLGGQWPLIASA
jgi:hypothetical protein